MLVVDSLFLIFILNWVCDELYGLILVLLMIIIRLVGLILRLFYCGGGVGVKFWGGDGSVVMVLGVLVFLLMVVVVDICLCVLVVSLVMLRLVLVRFLVRLVLIGECVVVILDFVLYRLSSSVVILLVE